MDYQALLYGPIYDALGVPLVLHLDRGDETLVALDKTAGLTINQAVDLQTVRPAATVRAAELAAKGIMLEDLDGQALTMNGGDWRIESLRPKPSPNGEGDGEIYLFLDRLVV